jgi:phage terminase large subunit GpA-like protein
LNVWEWAEEKLVFSPRISSSSGKYRTALTPYVRQPLNDFQDPHIREITMCWGAQTSKTTTETVALAYTICNAPGPVLFVMPSKDIAQSFSETRLQPLIEDCPELVKHKKADRHAFKKCEMMLDACNIFLVGANSPSNLASRAIKYLFLDEIDKYPPVAKKEADPISLATERTKTYPDRKIFRTSTPTVEGGAVWQAWQAGSQHRYFVPCPHCKKPFTLEWSLVKWDDIEDDNEAEPTVHVECPKCKKKIQEKHKRTMIARGEWLQTNNAAPKIHRSYHLSELYSTLPGSSWGGLMRKFRKAVRQAKTGDTRELQNFINSSLAEPWKPEAARIRKDDEIRALRDAGRSRGVVPCYMPVAGITAGVDTQDNGWYYVIRAWGGGEMLESWLVREGFVDTFEALSRVLWGSQYVDANGREYVVNAAFMDSQGHRTSDVYDWCREHKDLGVRPTKGEQRLTTPWVATLLDTYPDSRRPIPGGLNLYRIHTTFFKNWLSTKLRIDLADAGAWHVHADITEDYVRQMTAEYRDENGIWVCPKGRDNHYWDAEVLALAAADWAGIKTWAVDETAPEATMDSAANIQTRETSRRREKRW